MQTYLSSTGKYESRTDGYKATTIRNPKNKIAITKIRYFLNRINFRFDLVKERIGELKSGTGYFVSKICN